jgi:hypothetical protein
MRQHVLSTAVTVSLAVFALACGSSPEPLEGAALNQEFESIALGRAAIEFPCSKKDLSVIDLPGYAYRVTGCGYYATYECDYDNATGDSTSSQDNYWIYTCDRAVQDNPSKLDAGDGGQEE